MFLKATVVFTFKSVLATFPTFLLLLFVQPFEKFNVILAMFIRINIFLCLIKAVVLVLTILPHP